MTEFLDLKQGNNTVLQYAQTFNQLSQYGGFHVDTDEKKQDCFRGGLSTKLQNKLALTTCNNFTELVVAKMASHAIFQYNVLVIDIDNTTLGLI